MKDLLKHMMVMALGALAISVAGPHETTRDAGHDKFFVPKPVVVAYDGQDGGCTSLPGDAKKQHPRDTSREA